MRYRVTTVSHETRKIVYELDAPSKEDAEIDYIEGDIISNDMYEFGEDEILGVEEIKEVN